MTDQPKTVALDASEWKDLVVNNAVRVHGFILSIDCPTPEQLQAIGAHLDRMRALTLAWHKSQRPNMVGQNGGEQVPASSPLVQSVPPSATKRQGWPLGKKRGPRKPKA